MRILQLLILVLLSSLSYGQFVEIPINNPSFEDIPHKGGGDFDIGIRGWYDCSRLQFRNETPPDIHPINAWNVTKIPSEGRTYLGMVVRDNDSWESVSQRLGTPLEAGKCYTFSIDLARSEYYISGSRTTQRIENYVEPSVLRIWGGTGICGRQELLGESVTVANYEWRGYEFEFRPNRTVNYITLEAFYKVPVLIPYNGHLLLDNASLIKQMACNEEELLASLEEEVTLIAQDIPKPKPELAQSIPSETKTEIVEEKAEPEPQPVVRNEKPEPVKPSKIIAELDEGKTVKKGQVIRVHSIYFKADSSSLEERSEEALKEIYDFLEKNESIVVEIGGHTSTQPREEYCDQLSTRRAKEVASYLAREGISTKRLYYKGYGKRNPIIRNDKFDMLARKKNQRVEIKILSTTYRES